MHEQLAGRHEYHAVKIWFFSKKYEQEIKGRCLIDLQRSGYDAENGSEGLYVKAFNVPQHALAFLDMPFQAQFQFHVISPPAHYNMCKSQRYHLEKLLQAHVTLLKLRYLCC